MSMPHKIIILIGFQASRNSTAAQILRNNPNTILLFRDN